MGKVLKIAGITASVIIGSGFATGNEIKKYFTQYGVWGYSMMALCAMVLFAGVRERLESSNIPKCFKGFPICLITAGLMSMAFMGFSGLVG